jgi:hypothetical protein
MRVSVYRDDRNPRPWVVSVRVGRLAETRRFYRESDARDDAARLTEQGARKANPQPKGSSQ